MIFKIKISFQLIKLIRIFGEYTRSFQNIFVSFSFQNQSDMDKLLRSPEEIIIQGKTLREILNDHNVWLNTQRKTGKRANLSLANLSKANLSDVNLFGADLSGADMTEANLRGANLTRAYLFRINLIGADLSNADLSDSYLVKSDLSGADLSEAKLSRTNFFSADLSVTDLNKAILNKANLFAAILTGADLSEANLTEAILNEADLNKAQLYNSILVETNLTRANLMEANLMEANLTNAVLTEANLTMANLIKTNLTGANLRNAYLNGTVCVETNFTNANIENASIHGISVWNIQKAGLKQNNLIITSDGEPVITVDDIEVAQFIYLMLNNEKIRDVLGTITSKCVLILGRFTPERKIVLDAIRDKLRENNLVPIMFDFEKASERDYTETIKILAGMSRFVIADITDPKSAPLELQATIPDYGIPFLPIIQEGQKPFSMFNDLFWKYKGVMNIIEYKSCEDLLSVFKKAIIDRAENKHQELLLSRNQSYTTLSTDDFKEGEKPKDKQESQ